MAHSSFLKDYNENHTDQIFTYQDLLTICQCLSVCLFITHMSKQKLIEKQQISDLIIFSSLIQVWGHSDNSGRRVRNISLGEPASQKKLICYQDSVMEEYHAHNI